MHKTNWWSRLLLLSFIIAIMLLTACGTNEAKEESNTEGKSDETNYGEAVDYTITGIEPGAGITVTTEKAIEEYDNLSGWELEQSSTAAMVTELEEAISSESPIVVTGWNPHWMFAKFANLKYLEDPKGIYGDVEIIKSLARKGLKEDKPNAYKLIDQFEWSVEDMEGIMYEASESGKEVADVAKQWVEDNPDKTKPWTEGVEDVDGVEIELVSTPWDSERASANVVAEVLRQKGFHVTITPVDVAVMFEAVANGDGDATLAAWLPATHKDFYEKFKDDFVDLGANLEGAKIGLVVPDYMDIDSIEDLPAK
ncbi:glycine betaine ABC transporter substrate-binding protein [Virgibacillus pantothenticus]|nr:glycine betaine ABC transporter substrate-binding protein [Virgibacillus pantothenticus]MEB5450984.1 glycine betaine ABC transporter substrate-binding protein [Virgibacillus pantothenticus]MEB5455122.1 glycine betaine ABC transporter substrate-binding protein [Virgibacillus pantothenticus]MEB5461148.1 glycine betaine ABC transporter substrate-binding protein [Virgibacillus pantothenticus]MEB5463114.1 glycine betaine ABC transporter substrate-binding protein [Virgibacillus pantothenticus]MEB